jgi:hypothetical protein
MGKNVKPRRLWAITYTNSGDVMPDTIRRTRREAQQACCDNRYQFRDGSDWRHEWSQWKKRGCRAVRVVVTVEPTNGR